MEKINNLEGQKGYLTDDEKEYILKYIVSVMDKFFDLKCPKDKKDILEENKTNIIKKLYDIFCNVYLSCKKDGNIKNDISYLNHGFFSFAFKVGNTVIKVKLENGIYLLKDIDSNFVIKKIYDEKLNIGDDFYLKVSVYPYAATREFDEEEVYQVYKGLRQDGYIWNDPKSENVGILVNDNSIAINGNSCYFLKKDQNVGDIVVIDIDDIADVRGCSKETLEMILDEICFCGYNSNTYDFEIRYREETNYYKQ